MFRLARPNSFLNDLSDQPRLKFAASWIVFALLVVTGALMISFGIPEKYVLPALLIVLLPLLYLAFCTIRPADAAAKPQGVRDGNLSALVDHTLSKNQELLSIPELSSSFLTPLATSHERDLFEHSLRILRISLLPREREIEQSIYFQKSWSGVFVNPGIETGQIVKTLTKNVREIPIDVQRGPLEELFTKSLLGSELGLTKGSILPFMPQPYYKKRL